MRFTPRQEVCVFFLVLFVCDDMFSDERALILLSPNPAGSKLKDFKSLLEDGGKSFPAIGQLKDEVIAMSRKYPAIGQKVD